ncbi:MAG: metallophosphoesterase family protein [Candidatus Asgardarchaeia archaeon]
MEIVVIGDLHLPNNEYYPKKKYEEFISRMRELKCDVLAITGDICDCTSFLKAKKVMEFIENIDAKYKVGVVGNHDLWYGRRAKLYYSNPKRFKILDGEGIKIGKIGIAGTMGWFDYSFSRIDGFVPPQDDKIRTEIELGKLRRALRDIRGSEVKIVLMHFSPIPETGYGDIVLSMGGSKSFLDPILEEKVNYVFHGHLHNSKNTFFQLNGVKFYNSALSALGFYFLSFNPLPTPP